MPRDFDGVNDNIGYGSDVSIDEFASRTTSIWLRWDGSNAYQIMISKHKETVPALGVVLIATTSTAFGGPGSQLAVAKTYTINDAIWRGSTQLNDAVWRHIVITHTGDGNTPGMYVNATAETVTLVQSGSGTEESDATRSLTNGESDDGLQDLNGAIAFFAYDDAVWSAAEINRARWWGRPFGGLQVYHPLLTAKLTNEGAATANGTATGTTVVPAGIPVVRPGTAMMGMGIGW